ncbi:hypothetical protein [Chryseobacterium sp. MDT2-18]|uniref:hypothetical protein n=1 Tax=Chryseobacterium sp. MDT2-18 TaxID=1259136 RepID=UPI0027805EEA|nr:hypothetical protein [Chryseobacterium sp. MDT2-18]MDQ0476949.1 hypothetical protein [Chryseobacterium sp. MDT2-18]
MKKILQIFTLLFLPFLYGQQVSDYQYIYVPEKFSDTEVNKFDLNDLLKLKLKQKKFTVITESKEKWPAELLQNPCHILTAELLNSSNMFKNRLKIEFKDCQTTTISSLEGKSSIKEFEPGMRDALEDAAKKVPVSMPVEKSMVTEKVEPAKIKQKSETVKKDLPLVSESKNIKVVPAPKEGATAGQKAEVYSNGTLSVNRIFLANGEFILVHPNNSVLYATFKPSTKKDVYRVQLADETATLGYFENGEIIVELVNSDGSFRKEVFSKK